MNRIQCQPGLSLPEFFERYGTERQCQQALAQARWPQGVVCPRCKGTSHSLISTRTHPLYQCSGGLHQRSLNAGAVMQANKLPLTKFLARAGLLCCGLRSAARTILRAPTGVGARKPRHLPRFKWINTVLCGQLKRRLSGSYHAFDLAKHAHRYPAAFAYRFNRRFNMRHLPTRWRQPAARQKLSGPSGLLRILAISISTPPRRGAVPGPVYPKKQWDGGLLHLEASPLADSALAPIWMTSADTAASARKWPDTGTSDSFNHQLKKDMENPLQGSQGSKKQRVMCNRSDRGEPNLHGLPDMKSPSWEMRRLPADMHRGQRPRLGNQAGHAIKAGYKDAAGFFATLGAICPCYPGGIHTRKP